MEILQVWLKNTQLRHPLAMRLVCIVLLKVAVLLLIRQLWFSAPSAWQGHEAETARHVLSSAGFSSSTRESADDRQ